MPKYGLVTEQGDLGLGFNPLSDNDQVLVENSQDKRKKENNKENNPNRNNKYNRD